MSGQESDITKPGSDRKLSKHRPVIDSVQN